MIIHPAYGAVRCQRQLWLALLALLTAASCNHAMAASPPPPVQLLILGDSLSAGYGLPIPDGFEAQLAAALQADHVNVNLIDGAVSGDTSTDAAARLDWVLAGGQIDAAIVELGGNDGLRGLDPGLMQRNLTYILDSLAAKHIPVLLSGMLAPPSLGTAYGDHFKTVFQTLGQRPGIVYDPFFLTGIAEHPVLLQSDGIHPNAAGVKLEVKRLLPIVLKLIAKTQRG